MADELSEALEVFELCVEAEAENRERGREDYEFARLADQWPEEIREKRRLDGRPCLTVNRMAAFGRQVVNEARQNKISIKVRPADDNADIDTAEVMSGLIRNIEQQSNADIAYDTGAECAVYMGVGFWRVGVEYAHDDSFDKELKIIRIPNRFSVYEDPFSTESDSSDWNHGFVTEWFSNEQFLQRWPKASLVSWQGGDASRAVWADREAVQVAEYWKRSTYAKTILLLSDGTVIDTATYERERGLFDSIGATVVQERETTGYKVTQRIMTADEILEEVEWAGCYIPIVPCYGDELNVDGKRVLRSLIHDAKDSQRMLNFWRTSSTELVALAPKAPFIGPESAFTGVDSEKWATANNDNHAFISHPDGIPAPVRQPFAGVPAGAVQEAALAQDDMKSILGIYDASLGARSNETSGIAIRSRKVESDTATYHFVDNLSRAVRHTGRILIDMIPKVYTANRVVRILGMDGAVQNVRLGPRPDNAQVQPQGPQEPGTRGLEGIYDLSVGRYDVMTDVGPAYVTQRQEAADQMMQLIQSFPQAAPIIGDLVAKNLDWPGAQEIAERLKALLPPQINDGIPPQLTQQLQQLQEALNQAMAEVGVLKQSQANDQAKAQIDMMRLEVEKFKAETERMVAVREAQNAAAEVGTAGQVSPLDQAKVALDAEKINVEKFKAETERLQVETQNAALQAETMSSVQGSQAAEQLSTAAAMLSQVVAAFADAQVAPKPKTKRGVASRQPDGSYVFESVEE